MFDEIILINNDKYGAAELKKLYQGFTLKGFIIAVTFHLALIAAYMLITYFNEAKAKDIPKGRDPVIIVEFDETPPPIDDKEIPPIKEEIANKVKDLASLQPEPVKKEVADDVVLKTQDELNEINTSTSREGDSLVLADNTNIKIDTKLGDKIDKEIKEPVKDIYNIIEVEVAPECTNLHQIRSEVNYPPRAIEIGLEGRVTVRVLVGPDGSVVKVGAVSGNKIFHDEVRDK
ncbi:MAG: energy transducer TonB, partial [Chlorobi bacterium]|nr:energy transducer TonB [Chlorobiota bacterium]